MSLRNEKGFTLIELLAVIVILSILLSVAIPSVTGYINSAKKSAYTDTVLQYISAARYAALAGEFELPTDPYTATVIPFELLVNKLDKSGKTSPYGGSFLEGTTEKNNSRAIVSSYVVIVCEGENGTPRYYATADDGQYVIGQNSKQMIISEDELAAAKSNYVTRYTGNSSAEDVNLFSIQANSTRMSLTTSAGTSGKNQIPKSITINSGGAIIVRNVSD